MGFKNAGFPHYSFNPMGFRTRGGFQQKLQDECGLLLGSTDLEIDRVGKSSRDAVQGVEIVGDGSTYIKNILLANLALTYIDATTLLPVVSAWDANGEFIIPANGVAGLTTVYLTKTYTLDTHGDWDSNTPYGVYQLVPEDTSETILCQQYLAPVTPTQINLGVVSLHDKYGWSKAIDLLEKGIDVTAEQTVIGIESTVGNDGQAQAVVNGLTVSYQVYQADVVDTGTVNFESVLNDNYFDALHGTILVGTGSMMTITNNTGVTADVGVIHMTGNIATATASKMTQIASTMLGNTDLQPVKNPILSATGKNLFSSVSFDENKTLAPGFEIYLYKVNIKLEPNTTYTCSSNLPFTRPAGIYFGGTSTDSNGVSDGISRSVTTDANGDLIFYIRFAGGYNAYSDIINGVYWIQLELGSLPTTYEPFKSSEMTILSSGGADWIGRSNDETSDKVYTYFGKIVQNINPVDNTTLATPIITDADITIVDENGNPQDYWHLYENGQISGEAEELLPIIKYRNLQGMTVPYQDRVTYDEAGDYPIDIDTLIPNYENGVTSTAYVDGVHPSGVYHGRVKFDATEDGTTWQIADKYHELIIADDTNILYDALGEPKELTIATQPNITEDKFFFDATTKKTLFFEEPLTGSCKVKANSWMGFNEIFMVSDGEGGYIPYVVDGETMYVLKEGVTRV